MSIDGFVTLREASQKYGISERQLRRLCQNREVEAIKIAGVWLVKPESVADYCKSPTRRSGRSPPK